LIAEGTSIRRCRREDAPAVLGLWAQERSEHASIGDRLDQVERLIDDSEPDLISGLDAAHGRSIWPGEPTTENAPAGSRGEFWGYYREERYVSLYMWIRGR
jgi:hypothetical protein